jgi:hypothetical protein
MIHFILLLLLLLTPTHTSACADDDVGMEAAIPDNYKAAYTDCAGLPSTGTPFGTFNLCTRPETKVAAEEHCPVTCNACPPAASSPSPAGTAPSPSAAKSFWCSSPASGVHTVESSTSSNDNSCTLTNVVTVQRSTSLELSSDNPGTQAVISGTRTLYSEMVPVGKRLFFLEENSNLTLTDLILEKGTTFLNDSTIIASGFGGGIYASESTCIRMTRTVVRDCQAQFGGGLHMKKGSMLILEDAVFESNVAINGGGGVQMIGATLNIVVGSSATFASNKVVGLPQIPDPYKSLAPVDSKKYRGGAAAIEQ